ncbi:MAG TPA: c-type cytochrome [Verrucomicrobiae bacterium]|nr:c-type cytochrome [Verrucomicrobiae bacterium]
MNRRLPLMAICLTAFATAAGCNGFHGVPVSAAQLRPDQVLDFETLYSENCAGCHGERGQGGAAIAIASPVYLSIAGDDVLRNVMANGVPGTPMPAFAQKAGGMLTEPQVSALVSGIRNWAKPDDFAGVHPPAYAGTTPGNPSRGADVYATFCSSCHGADGKGGKEAGSVVDPSFLALISDQGLRTVVIVGRPEFNAPDWRGDVPGHPMTGEQVSDVVAWLAAQRVRYPGQPYPAQDAAGQQGAKE